MSSSELSLFSYEILGLVGRGGAGAHDLLRMARPRADARLGRREPVLRRAKEAREARLPRGTTRTGQDPRTHRLHAHRARGSRRSASTRRLQCALRHSRAIRSCDSSSATSSESRPPEPASLTLREDIADLMERLEDSEATARSLPHRSKYLLLVTEFLRRYLELHLELVDQVERDFAAEEPSEDRATPDPAPVKR